MNNGLRFTHGMGSMPNMICRWIRAYPEASPGLRATSERLSVFRRDWYSKTYPPMRRRRRANTGMESFSGLATETFALCLAGAFPVPGSNLFPGFARRP